MRLSHCLQSDTKLFAHGPCAQVTALPGKPVKGCGGPDSGCLENQEKKERSDLNSFGCEVELRKEKRKEKNKEN